jgi:hypothetical protein
MATEADWHAYRTAVVDLSPPGRPALRIVPDAVGSVGAWPDGLAAPVVVVTAWNPDSVRLAADVNTARNRLLVRELATRGLAWWPATGRDPADSHGEEGAAVTGLAEDDATDLGRRHGQAAVYLWTPDAWEVVACDRSRRDTLGWRLADVPAASD